MSVVTYCVPPTWYVVGGEADAPTSWGDDQRSFPVFSSKAWRCLPPFAQMIPPAVRTPPLNGLEVFAAAADDGVLRSTAQTILPVARSIACSRVPATAAAGVPLRL